LNETARAASGATAMSRVFPRDHALDGNDVLREYGGPAVVTAGVGFEPTRRLHA